MAFSFGGFGNNSNNQQQAQPAQSKPTFSFGTPAASSTPAAGASSTPSFSLFGNPSSAAKPATPSLFGAAPQPAAATSTPSLFGGFGQQNQTQNQATPATNARAPAASGFSFGGFGANKPAVAPAANAPSTGLFGSLGTNNAQQQQQSKPGFSFGTPAASTSNTTAAPSLNFGASTSQQPQQTQNSQSSPAPITKSTRFEDLPEPARKMIEEIETYIQGRIAIYDSLKAAKLGQEIEETSLLLRQLETEFAALSNHLAHDNRYTTDLRNRFEQSLRDAVKAVQIVDSYRVPQQGIQGQGLGSSGSQNARPHPAFLQEFFRRKGEELARRLATYKTTIEQLRSQLSRTDPDSIRAILPTLKAQHGATLQLASRLSNLESGTAELKDEYRDLWRERTGSVRDPFIERRREVLGSEAGVLDAMGGISIR